MCTLLLSLALSSSLYRYTHTSIVHDELDNILDLIQSQPVLPVALPLVAMNSYYHSIRHEASLDCLKVCVAHGVDEEERLLADSPAIVVIDCERPTLLLVKCDC